MSKVFPITPVPLKAFSVIGIVIILLVITIGSLAYSALNTRFEINSEGLHIKGAIFGRFIPKESIMVENTRILNLNVESDLKPVRRTWGTSLPGYNEGWFKLANGERALLFVSDRVNVVYIPTREGYSVLLSTVNHEKFLESLNKEWN